ncbi:MAG: chloride channel protein [Syntrophaceae bacterium]|nr:chloride channel protein [Syntrophaceae bacterium]
MDETTWQRSSLQPFRFFLLSILIGVVAGLGAVAFRGLIAFFHNLLFLGKLSVVYDANVHTSPSPWGLGVIFVPVVGAIGVTFLVQNFAPEAKGHGVPEVMDAIYYHKGIIRPVVALIKSIASALSIGSGGSVGREGPIVQIGSSFGSTVGQILRMPTWQRIILIAAGTGAGIAATFNTPIGGVLFAYELMLHEVSVKTIVPVAIATVTATYIGQIFFGPYPSFMIPSFEMLYFHIDNPLLLLSYASLGILLGAASAVYIKSIYVFEDFFDQRIKRNPYLRHMIGMLLVGIIIYLLMASLGYYYVEGVGYATLQDIFTDRLSEAKLLGLLFILKLFATSVTLGSGASGGIFSPSLYLGATLGGTFGLILRQIFPELPIDPPAFAVAGMAGMTGGATGAPMAAIVMIFEMTLNYNVIIPMTITVAIGYGVRTMLSKESIYTMKLARRGHIIPQTLQANFQQLRRARELMDTHFMTVPASMPLRELIRMGPKKNDALAFLVENRGGEILGVVSKDTLVETLGESNETTTLEEVAHEGYVTVLEETTLFAIAERMRSRNVSIALVTNGSAAAQASNVKGLITRQQIGGAIVEANDFFSE